MKKTLAILCLLSVCGAVPVVAQAAPKTAKAKINMVIDRSMKMMDANGDGKVSMDERSAACKTMFISTDTNADGLVSAEEMTAMGVKDMADMKLPVDQANVTTMVQSKIKAMDTDADGMVSMEEEDAASQTMFAKTDTDKDGFLSKAEMSAAMMMEMKGKM